MFKLISTITILICFTSISAWGFLSPYILSNIAVRFLDDRSADCVEMVSQTSLIWISHMVRDIKHFLKQLLTTCKFCLLFGWLVLTVYSDHLPTYWLAALFCWCLISISICKFWTSAPCLKFSCYKFLSTLLTLSSLCSLFPLLT